MSTRVKGRVGASLLAAGLVSIAAGLGVTAATASGEFTTVALTSPASGTSTTFTWSYSFAANEGHDLSNIAIRFCSQDVLDHVVSASPNAELFKDTDVPGGHTGFGHGVKFDVTTVTGNLSVTFDKAFGAGSNGVFVQSHSGDGQDGDEIKSGDGPDGCAETTTTVDPSTTTTTVPASTTTTLPATTTTVPATTTTVPATTTTLPATTTTVPVTLPPTTLVTTIVTTTVPTTVPPTTAPPTTGAPTTIAAQVLGVSERNTVPGQVAPQVAANLARTGSNSLPLLVGLGLALSIVGLGLLVGEYVGRPAD